MPDTASETVAAHAPADHRLVIRRVFQAPRALVWAAWTQPEHIVRWWGPHGDGAGVSGCEIDLCVGGSFRLMMHGPDGCAFACNGVFREVVPPQRLVYEGPASSPFACGAGLPPRATVTVTFEEVDGGTALTMTTVFDSAAMHDAAIDSGLAQGWPLTLDSLAAYLADIAA